jgi:hypothetical protein
MKEEVTLNRKEQNRVIVLNQVEKKGLTVDKTAQLLKLAPRHVWRLLVGYRRKGPSAIAHGNRVRKPVNTIAAELRQLTIHRLILL